MVSTAAITVGSDIRSIRIGIKFVLIGVSRSVLSMSSSTRTRALGKRGGAENIIARVVTRIFDSFCLVVLPFLMILIISHIKGTKSSTAHRLGHDLRLGELRPGGFQYLDFP